METIETRILEDAGFTEKEIEIIKNKSDSFLISKIYKYLEQIEDSIFLLNSRCIKCGFLPNTIATIKYTIPRVSVSSLNAIIKDIEAFKNNNLDINIRISYYIQIAIAFAFFSFIAGFFVKTYNVYSLIFGIISLLFSVVLVSVFNNIAYCPFHDHENSILSIYKCIGALLNTSSLENISSQKPVMSCRYAIRILNIINERLEVVSRK